MGQLHAEWLRFDDFCFSGLVYLRRAVAGSSSAVAIIRSAPSVPHPAAARCSLHWEDTHHVGTPFHLFVQALQRGCGVGFHLVCFREAEGRQHVCLCFVHHPGDRRVAFLPLTGNLAQVAWALFSSVCTNTCCSAARTTDWFARLTRLSTLRMKWTRQRCQLAENTCLSPPSGSAGRSARMPFIHASWITALSAFSDNLWAFRKGGKYVPLSSFGIRRSSVPS